MGCVTSKKDINDLHPHIFQVKNVDDLGNPLNSGQLEVNETELILYQQGKPPVRWPLKSLRRYGYDSQYFSFEAGRRCPTGSGIYAFSCRRAERLFNFVQAHIQMTNNDDGSSREAGTPTPQVESNYLEPTPIRHGPPRLSLHNNGRLSSVGSSNGCTSPSTPNYTNEEVFQKLLSIPDEVVIPVDSRPISVPTVPTGYQNIDSNQPDTPVYMNVILGDVAPEEDSALHCYANVAPGEFESLRQIEPSIKLPPLVINEVNYAELDLDNGSELPPPSPGALPSLDSPKPSEGYVTIDFDRTVALSQSVNSSLIEGEGIRKTRHDSAMNDLVTPTSSRHSASLSD